MIYKRFLSLEEESKHRSLFLFGPRLTGKTFLLKKTFPEAPYYDLLLSDLFMRLSSQPRILREEIYAISSEFKGPVIIDEIQKLPILLDEVHHLIEEKGVHFILTGSSARKLKRENVNLLGGRARTRYLFPLVSAEITDFNLIRALNYGTIPAIYLSDDPEEDLIAYCGNYLQQEILEEGLVRRIENFSRFLKTAAFVNTELVNFEVIARDCAVPARTVREYFYLLEDTLVGALLYPYRKTLKRKPISRAKFYFFDVGVANTLAERRDIHPKKELFGKALEHFIFLELRSYLSYTRDRRELSFWRSRTGYEVDFLIGDELGIEVKAANQVDRRDFKGLLALSEELALKHKIVVSMDERPRKAGDVDILPVNHFLNKLWDGAFIR
ncbi:MAG: AAA family ATPase [Spirochaetes bacterium]|nr:MAG: AAA family ATPase [Spirochaetota bacterium]